MSKINFEMTTEKNEDGGITVSVAAQISKADIRNAAEQLFGDIIKQCNCGKNDQQHEDRVGFSTSLKWESPDNPPECRKGSYERVIVYIKYKTATFSYPATYLRDHKHKREIKPGQIEEVTLTGFYESIETKDGFSDYRDIDGKIVAWTKMPELTEAEFQDMRKSVKWQRISESQWQSPNEQPECVHGRDVHVIIAEKLGNGYISVHEAVYCRHLAPGQTEINEMPEIITGFFNCNGCEGYGYLDGEVIAWMPLPKYKPE